MRRADREIREFDRMLAVADACDCCRLGLLDDAGAYIVPLNFGYEAEGEKLTLYFHGAGQGKKIDLIREQKSASFEMDTRHALVEGETAVHFFLIFLDEPDPSSSHHALVPVGICAGRLPLHQRMPGIHLTGCTFLFPD